LTKFSQIKLNRLFFLFFNQNEVIK